MAVLLLSAATVAGQAANPSCPCIGELPNDAATRSTNDAGEAVRLVQLGEDTFQYVLLSPRPRSHPAGSLTLPRMDAVTRSSTV
jgi:hypothetical protein